MRFEIALLAVLLCSGCLQSPSTDGDNDKWTPGQFEREFQKIEFAGLSASKGSCDANGGLFDLRFVLMADNDTPIKPGEPVARSAVELSRDDISINNVKLFDQPDVLCGSGAEDRLCGGEFACGKGAPELGARLDRCLATAMMGVASEPTFVADIENHQAFGVLYENSGSIEGWLPSRLGNSYYDADGDLIADTPLSPGPERRRATDPDGQRLKALFALTSRWRQAREHAAESNRNTRFGLWEFGGTQVGGVQSLVASTSPSGEAWTTEGSVAESARDALSEPRPNRGNVYMAMAEVLEDDDSGFLSSELAGHDKTLVIFVDGPDELRLPAFDSPRVIRAAEAAGARVFIVHLDAELEAGPPGDPYLRDDPFYYLEQLDGCSSDADCKDYEQCRVPRGTSSSANGMVEEDAPIEQRSVCMIERDQVGRTGPIGEYADIACATEGGYIYLSGAAGLRNRMSWLPMTMDGLWQLETRVDRCEDGTVPPGRYKLQSTLGVNLGGRVLSLRLSQNGEQLAGPEDEDADTRAALLCR